MGVKFGIEISSKIITQQWYTNSDIFFKKTSRPDQVKF
jgi:hypothetical protein